MHIEVYATHNQVADTLLKDKNVIIIDVLRATSVICTALANGAKRVMTTHSIEEAYERKAKDANLLLGGERNAEKIKGFDFGNSPLEYTRENVLEKSILLSTTNGTQAVKKSFEAKRLIAASFLNLNAIVDYILKINEDFSILCSGTNGNFSLDDGLCAGLIIAEFRKRQDVSTNDFGELLVLPFKEKGYSLNDFLKQAHHVKTLKNKGLSADIEYCLNLDLHITIPTWIQDGFEVLKE